MGGAGAHDAQQCFVPGSSRRVRGTQPPIREGPVRRVRSAVPPGRSPFARTPLTGMPAGGRRGTPTLWRGGPSCLPSPEAGRRFVHECSVRRHVQAREHIPGARRGACSLRPCPQRRVRDAWHSLHLSLHRAVRGDPARGVRGALGRLPARDGGGHHLGRGLRGQERTARGGPGVRHRRHLLARQGVHYKPVPERPPLLPGRRIGAPQAPRDRAQLQIRRGPSGSLSRVRARGARVRPGPRVAGPVLADGTDPPVRSARDGGRAHGAGNQRRLPGAAPRT